MLIIKYIFILTWKYCYGDLNELSIFKNAYTNLNMASLSINFILKNITAIDNRIIGTESIFRYNFADLRKEWRQIPVTVFNIER